MSTHCYIVKKNQDGTYTGVYCHLDGYPNGVGKILSKVYATDEQVDRLLSFGDLDHLGSMIGSKHFWYRECSARCRNWCHFETRDCGTPWEQAAPKTFADLFDHIRKTAAEWVYLWSDGKWTYSKVWNTVRFEFEVLPEFDVQAEAGLKR